VDVSWLLVPLSYALGAFPTANLVGRLVGRDPTREGSGNPGASNVYRLAGKRAGIAVLVIDLCKGAGPAAVGLAIGGRSLGVACGLAAMAGHVLPADRRFRGGKGVATLGGACLILYPLVSLCLLAIWVAVMRASRVAALGSLAMAALLPVGVAITGRPGWEVAATAAAAIVVIVRHRSNVDRLLRGHERTMS
jgi:acyl phosphate:glycerol-3-phosphate acyltransferase